LRDDLADWAKRLEGGTPADRTLVQERMHHWQQDSDFASVRDTASLGKLPEGERAEWRRFWQDVDALGRRAEATPARRWFSGSGAQGAGG